MCPLSRILIINATSDFDYYFYFHHFYKGMKGEQVYPKFKPDPQDAMFEFEASEYSITEKINYELLIILTWIWFGYNFTIILDRYPSLYIVDEHSKGRWFHLLYERKDY